MTEIKENVEKGEYLGNDSLLDEVLKTLLIISDKFFVILW